MIYSAPMPFTEALDSHGIKSLLPTTGRTSNLQLLESAIKLLAPKKQ